MATDDPRAEASPALRWQDAAAGETREPRSPWLTVAYAGLLLVGLAALVGIALGTTNHLRAMQSARGLHLTAPRFEIVDDDNPRALLHFVVENRGTLHIEFESYYFHLYHNRQRVGSSFAAYRGTQPDASAAARARDFYINQTVGPGETLELAATLYLEPVVMERFVRPAQAAGADGWSAVVILRIFPPFARDWEVVRLRVPLTEARGGG